MKILRAALNRGMTLTVRRGDPCFVYDDFVNALRAGGASGLLDECSEAAVKQLADMCEKWQQDYLGEQQFPYTIANELLILSTVLTINSRWREVIETELDRAKHRMTPAVMRAIVDTVYTLLAE